MKQKTKTKLKQLHLKLRNYCIVFLLFLSQVNKVYVFFKEFCLNVHFICNIIIEVQISSNTNS